MLRIGGGVLALVLVVLVGLMTWEPFFARETAAPSTHRTYRAEILRSDYGVPHIYGETDADVAYGVAIAQSEDDFFTLQDVVAMSKGRYGAIAGPDGAQVDYVYYLLDARGTAERQYGSLPADTRAIFDAYATGLNQYAEENPDELKLAGLFPVNGEDVAAGFALRQPFFFGLAGVIGQLSDNKPPRREFGPDIPGFPREGSGGDEIEVERKPAQTARAMPLPWGEMAALSGSNAFAVAPEKSGEGTILISNSHQPLEGGVAWYEMVVESGEGWHFTGANFPGSPFPFLGHNRTLGWTNTVNRPDMVDIYELVLNEDGTQYRLDGEWRDLEAREVTLPVKLGPLVLPIRETVYRSVHGPVIVNDNGAFAMRYGGIDNIDQLDAYYRLNKASTLEEWQAILSRMDVPSTNFIYGDAEGNIAMVYNAAIPDRPEGHDWRGILPGDRSDLIWDGPVDYAAIPKYVNPASGWLMNANNTPFRAAGPDSDLSPDSVSPYLGVELKQTNRSRRAWKLMSEAGRLDNDTLRRIKYDTAYEREGYVADLWDALEQFEPGDADLGEARRILLEWDFTADNVGPGDALALLMIRDFMSAEYQNKAEAPDVATHLRKAVDHLQEHFGRLDPPMSELLRLRQDPGLHAVDLPLDGGSDTLRASTTWQVDPDGRLRLVHGDSFIQWVEWRPGERVRSRSVQPFGAAITRPDSPHFTDQATLFVQKKLKPVHFWREDALANARSRKIVTNQKAVTSRN
ncbi:penicillin amidase family protein [Erythrobacter litoralis HTCC2594]|uniref:Penicillin amidase family protein n=2 Tax=Erythrobacter litoralis TaxID=39960 RepID=Q2ND64_ERYLH|nr:penicillin amidase family protein [Erythrobacter litoralis HTCC2594]